MAPLTTNKSPKEEATMTSSGIPVNGDTSPTTTSKVSFLPDLVSPTIMNVPRRRILTGLTAAVFILLAWQTCWALPVQVTVLAAGIVLLGSLAYLAARELHVLWRLTTAKADDDGAKKPTARIVAIRSSPAGWQRLQVEFDITQPSGGGQVKRRSLRKWVDDTSPDDHSVIGETVSVTLSKDWRHCRLVDSPRSFCRSGPSMTVLTMIALAATGKTLFLCIALLFQTTCGATCGTFPCGKNEVEIRFFYALLAGAAVYTELHHCIQQRYYKNLPSLTEYEFCTGSDASAATSSSSSHGKNMAPPQKLSCIVFEPSDVETVALAASSWDDDMATHDHEPV